MKRIETLKWAASLKKLRRIIGTTQPEFAELIGVSTGLIKYVETGRRNVTRKLGAKIQMATGAIIGESKVTAKGFRPYEPLEGSAVISVWTRKGGVPFTLAKFQEHRATCQPERIDDLVKTLAMLFKAASRVKTGKLHGLRWSFMEWAQESIDRFKLPVQGMKKPAR